MAIIDHGTITPSSWTYQPWHPLGFGRCLGVLQISLLVEAHGAGTVYLESVGTHVFHFQSPTWTGGQPTDSIIFLTDWKHYFSMDLSDSNGLDMAAISSIGSPHTPGVGVSPDVQFVVTVANPGTYLGVVTLHMSAIVIGGDKVRNYLT